MNHWESPMNLLNLEISLTFSGRNRYLLEKWVMAERRSTKFYLIHVNTFERYQNVLRIIRCVILTKRGFYIHKKKIKVTKKGMSPLDSGLRRNDKKKCFSTFYEVINIDGLVKSRHPGENRGPEGF